MAFNFNNAVNNSESGSDANVAVAGTGVAAADLVVIWVAWEGAAGSTLSSVSDGSSTFVVDALGTIDNPGSNGEPHAAWAYCLSSVATGAPTYTATLSTAVTFKNIIVTYFGYTGGAVSRVAANKGSGTTVGSGTLVDVNTADIIVTGTDGLAFGAYAEYGSTMTASSCKINGVGNDRYNQIATNTIVWTKTYAAGFTGHATGTVNTENRWDLGIIAFEIGAAAGRTTKNTRACPLGMDVGMNWRGGP